MSFIILVLQKFLVMQVNVTIAGLAGNAPVKCSRDIFISPDEALDTAIEKGPFDVVILPGGLKGSQNLAEV
jgi:putative intracellular protease/amidase